MEKTTKIFRKSPDEYSMQSKEYVDLPKGYFSVGGEYDGVKLTRIKFSTPSSWTKEQSAVLDKFKVFWEKAEEYKVASIPQKRGYMFHGSHGNGKSTLVSGMIEYVVSLGGIALAYEDDVDNLKKSARYIKDLGNIPILIVIEDIDRLMEYSEEEALDLLSGISYMDGVSFVATTNFYDKLSERLIRTGRFDEHIELKPPSIEEKVEYLKRCGVKDIDAKTRKDIEELGMHQLQEYVVSTRILA